MSAYGQFLLKNEKNENFSKLNKYDILWSKITISGTFNKKTSKSGI
jgi:hypothetical protein